MTRFWKYQVRYRLARRLIHIGLFVMPEGRYKAQLLDVLWCLYDQVVEEVEEQRNLASSAGTACKAQREED